MSKPVCNRLCSVNLDWFLDALSCDDSKCLVSLYMDVGSYNLVNGCICWNILSCKVSMQSYISWWLCARIVGSDWSFWIKDRSVLSTASFTESFVWIAAKKCCNLSSLTGAKNGRFVTVSVVRDSTLRCDAYTCAVILLLSM